MTGRSEIQPLLGTLARLTFDYDTYTPGWLDSLNMSAGEYALEVLAKHGLVTGDHRWGEWTGAGIEFLTTQQQAMIDDPDYRESAGPKRKMWGHGKGWKELPLPDLSTTGSPEPMDAGTREIVGAIAGQCVQWHTATEANGIASNRISSGAPYGALEVLARYGLVAASADGVEWTDFGNEVLQD